MPKRQELDDDVLNDHEEGSKDGSPGKALEEIQKQETHDLYCPKCTRNITKTAQLFEKGDELSPDNQNTFVLWIPLFTPFKFLLSVGPVDDNSSNPNSDGSSNLSSNGSVHNNSSNPNPNRLAKNKMLERLPTLFRKSRVGEEENNVTNKEKDNNDTPLHQEGTGHQSSTRTSGKMKTSGIYAECEKHRHFVTYDEGWKYHHH